MSRRTKHLNHNKALLVGVGVMAIAVFAVVGFFLTLSFQGMETLKLEQGEYKLEFSDGFAGIEVQVYVNDSVLYDAEVPADTFRLEFKPYDEQHTLFVVDKKSGDTRSFTLSEKVSTVKMKRDSEGTVRFTEEIR